MFVPERGTGYFSCVTIGMLTNIDFIKKFKCGNSLLSAFVQRTTLKLCNLAVICQ